MNEPIISPWLIYAVGVIDSVDTFLAVIAICAGFIGFATLGVGLFCRDEEISNETFTKMVFYVKKLLIVAFITGACALFLPSRNTVIAMIVADNVTPANLESGKREAKELIDYVFEKIDRKEEEQ